jgi:hypothetical protein
MSALEALRAAHVAGIQLDVDGEDLVLTASVPPPTAVIDLLSFHKASIVALLRPAEDGWSAEDRQVFFDERAAIIEFDGGAPRAWAEALARLDPAHPPCDIPPERWLRFIDDCGRFLDDGWATRADALGWRPLDLFGCDRLKPFARVDCAGLIWLLHGRKLLALADDAAVIATPSGGNLTFRRSMREPGGVLAWELSTEADAAVKHDAAPEATT